MKKERTRKKSARVVAVPINRSSAVPAYYQIFVQLKDMIKKGKLKAGDMLPAEQDLADAFGVTKLTVRRAIQELVTQGQVIRHQGRLSQIAPPKIRLDPYGSLSEQVSQLGLNHYTVVLASKMTKPPKVVRERMRLNPQEEALHFSRVRWIEERPIALEDNYIVEKMAWPFLEDPARGEHLYQTLRRHCGLDEWKVDAEIELMSASAKEATELQVREGRPLLSLKLTWVSDKGAFGFTHVRFLAERFHFHFGFLQYPISLATREAHSS